MFNHCRPAEAIERYAGDEYIQHNPALADGKEAFIAYFMRMEQDPAILAGRLRAEYATWHHVADVTL